MGIFFRQMQHTITLLLSPSKVFEANTLFHPVCTIASITSAIIQPQNKEQSYKHDEILLTTTSFTKFYYHGPFLKPF
jgi:hypothetical protein